jgi:hypothetical protein
LLATNHDHCERAPEVSLTVRPGARSSRPVPHSPPTLARSGHPVGCHVARIAPCCRSVGGAGERRASQQHGPRRAPPAPSLLTPIASGQRLRVSRRLTTGGSTSRRFPRFQFRSFPCSKTRY